MAQAVLWLHEVTRKIACSLTSFLGIAHARDSPSLNLTHRNRLIIIFTVIMIIFWFRVKVGISKQVFKPLCIFFTH